MRISFTSCAPKFLLAGVLLKRVPPLPIPNREVKALATDDTLALCLGKVGLRRHIKILVQQKTTLISKGGFFVWSHRRTPNENTLSISPARKLRSLSASLGRLRRPPCPLGLRDGFLVESPAALSYNKQKAPPYKSVGLHSSPSFLFCGLVCQFSGSLNAVPDVVAGVSV